MLQSHEICQFLNNDFPCPAFRGSGSAPELTSLLSVNIVGRVQPFLSNPAGLSSGIDPTTAELMQAIPGSEVEVIASNAGLSVADPMSGPYTLEISALAEDVFTVELGFTDASGTESLRTSAIYHDTPIVLTFELDPLAAPALLLVPAVEPPVNVRVENVNGMTQLAWDASPDANATDYNIYARPDADPKFILLGTTTGTSFETGHAFSIGGSAVAWRYFVVARTAKGTESPFFAVLENRHRLVARLAADVTTGMKPLTVTFADQSSGEVSAWAWDFDSDGTIDSDDPNPTHLFETPGSYTVTLTVGGLEGTDTTIRAGFINVDPLVPPEPPVPGDFDGDADVDLVDLAGFIDRMNGPFVDPTLTGWHLFDLDPDYDVDLRDFAIWENGFIGE
ncbi:MAG: PKD domain-containing protein [Planctomycetota bacterium]